MAGDQGLESSSVTRRTLLAGFAVAAATGPAWSQTGYPDAPVRLLVPFPAGGNTDSIARVLAAWLEQRLGQSFVVDNQPGAGGTLAARTVARAEPNGRTLFVAALPQIAIVPAMESVPYDPVKSFTPISDIGTNPFVLMVNPSVPVKTLAELVALVRSQPGKMAYASAGLGSLAHLSMALLIQRAGLEMIHVPYKGDSFAMTDLMSGQVPVYFGNLSVAAPQHAAGAVRALAISDSKRHPNMPDVPTVAESGFPGFRTITWNGLLGPAGTPEPIVRRLAAEVQAACRDTTFKSRLANLGVDALGDTPAEFTAAIESDIKLWAGVIEAAGLARK